MCYRLVGRQEARCVLPFLEGVMALNGVKYGERGHPAGEHGKDMDLPAQSSAPFTSLDQNPRSPPPPAQPVRGKRKSTLQEDEK